MTTEIAANITTRAVAETASPVDVVSTAAITALVDVERRLAEATTPEDANVIRDKVAALQTLLGRRRARFAIAFAAAIAYLMASIRAGELWSAVRPGRGRRSDLATNGEVVSAESVGFASHQDASRCVELSLLARDDVEAYIDDCRQRKDLPTLGGALALKTVAEAKRVAFRDYSNGEPCAFIVGSQRCWHALHAHGHAPVQRPSDLLSLLRLAARAAREKGRSDVEWKVLEALTLARAEPAPRRTGTARENAHAIAGEVRTENAATSVGGSADYVIVEPRRNGSTDEVRR